MTMREPCPHAARPAVVDLIGVVVDRPLPRLAVVTVSGEVDMLTAPTLHEKIMEQLGGCEVVVLDLSSVSFFGSAGLTALIEARQRAMDTGVDLKLVAGTRMVTRPMAISGIDGGFQMYDCLADALA